MISLMNLSNYKKCRLWINELGNMPNEKEENVIESVIPSNNKKQMRNTIMAIEIFLPRNTSNYGLVGFEYVQDKDNKSDLCVRVCFNKKLNELKNDSLAIPNDKVFFGISEEYSQSILDSAVDTINDIGGLPSGEITFNLGAHAECGSSRAVFNKITRIIIILSQYDLLKMTKVEVQTEIESML